MCRVDMQKKQGNCCRKLESLRQKLKRNSTLRSQKFLVNLVNLTQLSNSSPTSNFPLSSQPPSSTPPSQTAASSPSPSPKPGICSRTCKPKASSLTNSPTQLYSKASGMKVIQQILIKHCKFMINYVRKLMLIQNQMK